MGVYKRNNGKWYCRGRINGERYHIPCTGAKDKEQAKALEDAERYRIRQKQKGLLNENEKPVLLGYMMNNCINVAKANNASWKDTERRCNYMVKYFGKNRNVLCISPSEIEKFKLHLLDKGRTNATVNTYLATIKRAYNLLIKDGLIVYNPMTKVDMLTANNSRNRHLTKEEWNRLKMALSPELYGIVFVALLTGLRRGNVLKLRWEQVDFNLKIIEVLKQNNKGRKILRIPMSELLIRFLQSIGPKEKGYVFINKQTGLPYTDIKKSFASALKRARITDFKFHDLRRTYGTWLLQSSVDARTIQQLLGHSDIRVTERYLALTEERSRSAVNSITNMLQ